MRVTDRRAMSAGPTIRTPGSEVGIPAACGEDLGEGGFGPVDLEIVEKCGVGSRQRCGPGLLSSWEL
jgi:hypothetical protein